MFLKMNLVFCDKAASHSISEFYDKVDRQLTLIINKQIMTFSGQESLLASLGERARENALRVFISGLHRPLCDILFSARPKDLPTALVTAQELETNHRRNDFARIFAAGSFAKTSKQKQNPIPITNKNNNVVPMEVDSSRMFNANQFSNRNIPQDNPGVRHTANNIHSSFANPIQNPNSGAIPKRSREQAISNKSRFYKQQRINHMPDVNDGECIYSDLSDNDESQSEASDIVDDISNSEINFLE